MCTLWISGTYNKDLHSLLYHKLLYYIIGCFCQRQGVTIDNKLTFNDHIKRIPSKANQNNTFIHGSFQYAEHIQSAGGLNALQ